MIEVDQTQSEVQTPIRTADQAQELLAELEQWVEYYQDGLLTVQELTEAKERILHHPNSVSQLASAH